MNAGPEDTATPASSRSVESQRLSWRDLMLPLLAAVALRAVFALAAGGTEPGGDERAYLLLGERWRTDGIYDGIWAPGYPGLIALLGGLFGDAVPDALRWLQVLLGTWVTGWIAALGAVIGGRRCGMAAGWIAAVYLPLAGFAGLLFSESLHLALFVPALTLLARGSGRARAVAGAGVLLGLAALVRESSALFIPLLAAWLVLHGQGRGATRGLQAATLLLGAGLAILPWTRRNAAVHGELVPIAVSTGGSVHIGLNAYDVNYDLVGLGADPTVAPGALRAAIRGAAPAPWDPATEGSPAERARANVRRGLAFAASHPLFFLRTRLVEVVDLLSPLSYPIRSLRLAPPGAPLGHPAARLLLAALSVAMVPALLLLALRGWHRMSASAPHRSLLAWTCAGMLCSALVNGLTRYRLPAVPLLVAFAALALAGHLDQDHPRRARAAAVTGVVLILLWIPSLEGVLQTLSALR